MTVNTALQDQAIDHEIDLRRFSTGVVNRMTAVLNRSDTRLTAELAQALIRLGPDSFVVQRLEAVLGSVKSLNSQAFGNVYAALTPEISDLSKVESIAQAVALRDAVPSVVQLRFPIAGVSQEQVYAAAMSRPFQGRLLKDWMDNLEASRMTAIRNTVRQGFVEGQTTADIIKDIRGTKALKYADGILERPRRDLAAVVNTALSHTAQTARQASVDANADLVKCLQWVSTLDNKTSSMCQIRDGLQYSADTHKPLDSSIPWGEGPGRLHFNCRSVSVPVLKSWEDLGFSIGEMPKGTRASMSGQVPADQNYAQWFAKQSTARQAEILGPVRAKQYADGASFDSFFNDKGKFLTLAQLAAKSGA